MQQLLICNGFAPPKLRAPEKLIIASVVDKFPQKLDVSPHFYGRDIRNLQTLVRIFRTPASQFLDGKSSNVLINMKNFFNKSLNLLNQ